MRVTPGPEKEPGPVWLRLEDQVEWYDRRAGHNQRWHKRLKVVQLVTAAAVPVAAAASAPGWGTAGLGALILARGMQQLSQFQQNWIGYRSAQEAVASGDEPGGPGAKSVGLQQRGRVWRCRRPG